MVIHLSEGLKDSLGDAFLKLTDSLTKYFIMRSLYKTLAAVLVFVSICVLSSAMLTQERLPEAQAYLEKMNVVFIGVDNPITVRIPGVAASDVEVSISGSEGSILLPTAKPGGYILRVTGGTKINLTVTDKSGKDPRSCGWFEYRVKRIPDPVTYVGAIRHEGIMLKNNLQNISGVFTRMENFDFDCAFRPQSFSMSVFHDSAWKEYKTTGPAINAEMKSALKDAMPEDKVLFHNVVAKGPDSTLRKMSVVLITVK